MSDLHLSTGSTKPPLVAGKLRLYSMKFCPYAERARLVLIAKKVPHDVVNVNLKIKPDWLFDLNSKGMVPILETPTEIITESLDICNYLDRNYPNPSLYPKEENKISNHDEIISNFDELISLYYTCIRKKEKALQEYVNEMMPHLQKLEDNLKGTFFGGEFPQMVDYMLWPWAERADVLAYTFDAKLPVNENTLPRIFSWCKAMRALEPVKKTIISGERLYKASLFHVPGVVADYDNI